MKIAILRKKYSFHGGAEGFSQSLINQLVSAGHEVHIYAIEWEEGISGNIHFHKISAITFNSALRDISFTLLAYWALKGKNYDIIQSHDKTLYQDIYRAGDGCHIEWLRQRWLRAGVTGKLSIVLNPYHWLILILERIIFKQHRYRKIIAISEMVKRNIVERYGVPSADISVIYNGVDLDRFHLGNRVLYRADIREQYGISDSDFVILFVGSGFERKGVSFLLKAVEMVQNPVTVLVVGKGSIHKLKNMSKRQRVIFCGPQKEIHKYYAAADVFVFPTIYEPFGNVHLEALASGLPVITTRLSGASEIISDGIQGFIVNMPENIEEIAQKITSLMNKEENRKLSSEARRLAEQFSFRHHIDTTIQFYNSTIKKTFVTN